MQRKANSQLFINTIDDTQKNKGALLASMTVKQR